MELCAACGKTFDGQAELVQHFIEDHQVEIAGTETESEPGLVCPLCGEEQEVDEDDARDLTECSKCERWFDQYGCHDAFECPSCDEWAVMCPHCREYSNADNVAEKAIECESCWVASPLEKWTPAAT